LAYFIGIDGGGTKTECILGDDENVRARITAPSCKIQTVGKMAAQVVIQNAIRGVCKQAKVDPERVSRICIGVAGYSGQGIAAALTAMVWEVVRIAVDVVGDHTIGMQAAFGDGPGVLVIAGTGSIAYGRDERGRMVRVGGWGPAISDEGSGNWIGRRAVGAMMRTADRGQFTALEKRIMDLFNVRRREDVATVANQKGLAEFAKLAPDVMEAARAGDMLAAEILNQAGAELAALAEDVIRHLWPHARQDVIPVGVVGGVFRNVEEVRFAFERSLRSRRTDVMPLRELVDPAVGALELARREAARKVSV
jgi:N-acetylglucosamine kinase-like BadF-type ATPase